jgi:choline dehydrogenase-like flavoprotein
MVHRLLSSGETCVGVQTHATDKKQSSYARHEVIVCAGVFETPKLLMLSGIGPSDANSMTDLTAISSGLGHNIPSPHVGQNIQDHPVAPHAFKIKDGHSLDEVLRPGVKNLEAKAEYKLAKKGPLASSLLEMSGFARTDDRFKKCKEWREEEGKRGHDPLGPQGQPHFEFDFLVRIFSSALLFFPCLTRLLIFMKQPCFASPFFPHVPEPDSGSYMTIVVSLLRPLSRGSLTLKSANALEFPLINMNYLDHPIDAVALREGVRFVDEIVLRGDGMKDIIVGEYPEGDGGIVRGTAQADGTSDGVYGAKKGERDEGKSVEGHVEHMLGLNTVRDNDEGMAQWLKGRVTSGYRKSFFPSSLFPFLFPQFLPSLSLRFPILTLPPRSLWFLQNESHNRQRRRQWKSPSPRCAQPSYHRR